MISPSTKMEFASDISSIDHLLDIVFNPPSSRAGESVVIINSLDCLRTARTLVPNAEVLKVCEHAFEQLGRQRGFEAASSVPPESLPIQRPAWRLFARLTTLAHPLVRFAAAIELATAWEKRRALPPARSKLLDSLSRKPISQTAAQFLERRKEGVQWPKELSWLTRTDQLLAQLEGSESAGADELTPDERSEAQIRDSTVYARLGQRAGVLDHRCLSPGLLGVVNDFIAKRAAGDRSDLNTACGLVIAAMAGVTADLLSSIRVSTCDPSPSASHWLNPAIGLFFVNLRVLAPEASTSGKHKATLIASRPLPRWVAGRLCELSKWNPEAETLGDLMPELRQIKGTTLLSFMPKSSQASWAQWIQSAPSLLWATGVHRVYSALLSANFSGVARSKVHYQRVPVEELSRAAELAYQSLGWGEAVEQSQTGPDFGVDAVPQWTDVQKADSYLKDRVLKLLPGRRAPWNYVVECHNAFAIWVAFRLMVSMGLREAHQLDIPVQPFSSGLTIANLTDKRTGERDHYLPILLPRTARRTIQSYRIHCRHVALRGLSLDAPPQAIERAAAVEAGESAQALFLIGTSGNVVSIGTRHVLEVLPPELWLAPDFGRKILENLLRQNGLDNQLIDLVLRHEVQGQEAYSTSSDLQIQIAAERASRAVDAALKSVLQARFRGLTSSVSGEQP